MEMDMDMYRCVECGFRIKTLFVQYSPGNIRLMKCENCKAVADEYIECNFLIILIDLILHKPKAYRHLLFNVLKQGAPHFEGLLWKSTVGYLLLDGYRSLVLKSCDEEWSSSISLSSLVWTCRKLLTDVFLGNLLFLGTFLLATKIFLSRSAGGLRNKDILLAILISSYFKMFLIVMMVWEFPSSVIFIIDLFVLSSNTVAVKVMTESAMSRCIGACFSAHAVKIFTTQDFFHTEIVAVGFTDKSAINLHVMFSGLVHMRMSLLAEAIPWLVSIMAALPKIKK